MRPASTGQSTNFPPEKNIPSLREIPRKWHSLQPARSKVPFTLKRRGDTSRL